MPSTKAKRASRPAAAVQPKGAAVAVCTDQPRGARTVVLPAETGRTQATTLAAAAMAGHLSNAATAQDFSESMFGAGTLNLEDCTRALLATVGKVKAGDLGMAEAMLVGQATALNAIFATLARRAAINLGQHLDATDRYLRLAFKAQNQSRATLETLAAVKNPSVVFARQANINNGGQQQVNNGSAPAVAHAGDSQSAQNKLLEAINGERMDAGAAGASGRANPHVEAVAAGHRPANR